MRNPFLEIPLDIYEKHMSLDTVQQLQILNNIMKKQLHSYEVSSVMILGIAGGNGLEHIEMKKTDIVYGVDINEKYLEACRQRYSELNGHLETICVDLTNKDVEIPKAKLVIANLFVEYIGYDNFAHHMKAMSPQFISVIIQINEQDGFVSESPYINAFDRVSEVHHQMEENELCNSLTEIGYSKLYRDDIPLPNGKKLVQMDFMKV
ncbi:MAG: methyltransferase domain-containing protein [Mobilitalea sp.]